MVMMDWARTQGPAGDTACGLHVTAASREDLLRDLRAAMTEHRGFSVATLNLDHVVKIRENVDFLRAYRRHTHITADGNPIVWLSRLAGQDVRLVPGSELIEPLAEIAAQTGTPVAFLGATQTSLDQAAAALEQRFPGLQVVARIAPPMGFDPLSEEAGAQIAALRASGARLCFLALGAPKQEILAARLQEQIPQMGVLSIGAGLDFISGAQTRAPRLFRLLAAEWLWRLAGNPGRLARRYGACLKILPGLFFQALRTRRGGTPGAKMTKGT